MKTQTQYFEYKKPSWAPPSWLFAPVWTVLYVLIAISFGFAFIEYFKNIIPFVVLLPFILNLIFNFAFTPIQFGLRNFMLATVDILLVLATLVWAIIAIHAYTPWISYINLPYLLWVCIATTLQISVTSLNKK